MVKRTIIFLALGLLIITGLVVMANVLKEPKPTETYVPELAIHINKTTTEQNKLPQSRYEVIKEKEKSRNKKRYSTKQITPIFNIDILTEKKVKNIDTVTAKLDSTIALIDTVAIYETILKQKKSEIKKNRVGGQKAKPRPIPKPKRYAATNKRNVKPSADTKKQQRQTAPPTAIVAAQMQAEQQADLAAVTGVIKPVITREKTTFNYYVKEEKVVDKTKFVRAKLGEKLKIRSGSARCELVLLESCIINNKPYDKGDILYGYSRWSGSDRIFIDISNVKNNNTNSADYVNLTVYDNDYQQGIIIDKSATQEKKRAAKNTIRDFVPNNFPGANTAKGLINTIVSGANGKVAKGFVVWIKIDN